MGRDSGDETGALQMARYVVQRMAPQELELFDETAAVVPRRARAGRVRDDPLGFGVAEASDLLFTGVACGVAREVFKVLAESTGERIVDRATAWWKRRRGRAADATEDAGLVRPEPHTLEDVRGVARRRAVLLGLPEDKADLLADAVVEYLGRPSGQQE